MNRVDAVFQKLLSGHQFLYYVFIKGPQLGQKLVDCNPNRTWPVFWYYISTYQIWIESMQSFKSYWADTKFRTDARTGVTLNAPPPFFEWRGHKNNHQASTKGQSHFSKRFSSGLSWYLTSSASRNAFAVSSPANTTNTEPWWENMTENNDVQHLAAKLVIELFFNSKKTHCSNSYIYCLLYSVFTKLMAVW